MLPILASAARKLNFLHAGTRAVEILRCLTRAHASYGTGYGALAVRFVDLYRSRKYSISEIAYLDLLNPRLTKDDLDRRQSKEQQLKLQLAINPREYRSLAANKAIFDLYCRRAGLAIPRWFGTFAIAPESDGSTRRESARNYAAALLGRATAGHLIVKPVDGVYGEAVTGLRVDGQRFIDDNGRPCSAEEVYDRLDGGSKYQSYLIQERLVAHSEIAGLTGTRRLQTVRMVTYVTDEGTVVIGCCQLKIVVGESTVDNFQNGRTGNLIGDIPGASGVLSGVIGSLPGQIRPTPYERHPTTGIAFAGFKIPRWDEARRLVESAAIAFLPLRTIGWDVAITDDGVFLIEGNVTWDPAYDGDVGGEILEAIRADQPRT
jgi:hypothetical protein